MTTLSCMILTDSMEGTDIVLDTLISNPELVEMRSEIEKWISHEGYSIIHYNLTNGVHQRLVYADSPQGEVHIYYDRCARYNEEMLITVDEFVDRYNKL